MRSNKTEERFSERHIKKNDDRKAKNKYMYKKKGNTEKGGRAEKEVSGSAALCATQQNAERAVEKENEGRNEATNGEE